MGLMISAYSNKMVDCTDLFTGTKLFATENFGRPWYIANHTIIDIFSGDLEKLGKFEFGA